MAYPRALTPRGEEILKEKIPQIEKLKQGESLTLTHPNPKAVASFRSYLYVWLSQQDLKIFFKLRQLSSTKLMVERLLVPAMKVIDEDRLSSEEQYVVDHLLEIESEDEVVARLEQDAINHNLPPEFRLKVIEEWRRVSGLD